MLTSSNDNKNVQFGLAYSGSIKPFGTNLLTFKLNGEVSRNSVTNSAIGKFTHWYAPFKYEVSMEKGKFVVSYQGTLVSNDLSGTYLRKDENNSNSEFLTSRKSRCHHFEKAGQISSGECSFGIIELST